MSYLLLLSEIKPINLEIVGVKAFNLSLYYKKQNIPSAFVLTKLGYQYLIEATGIKTKLTGLISNLNNSNIQETANSIQKLFIDSTFPKDLSDLITENYLALSIHKNLSAQEIINADNKKVSVILRLSKIENKENKDNLNHLSLLNIQNETDLLTAIKLIFASEYTLEHIRIRKENNLSIESNVAIIIQKMINPEKSILVNTENDLAKLKAVFGAGQALKDNNILFDEYEVLKEGLKIKNINIRNQTQKYNLTFNKSHVNKISLGEIGKMQKLSHTEIIQVAKIAFDIGENKLIEIAICGEEYYVLSINEIINLNKIDTSKLEVYSVLPKKDEEKSDNIDDTKAEMKLYDTLEPENELKQEPLEKIEIDIELIPKKEIRPIMEKIDDGVINYDEEDDLKEEFEREDYKVYEDDYATDKKSKKPIIKTKNKKPEDGKEIMQIEPVKEEGFFEDKDEVQEDTEYIELKEVKHADKKLIEEKDDAPEEDDSIFSSLKTY